MTVKLYGLKTCDTCRKAAKELGAAGIEVDFHDVRADPLSAGDLEKFLNSFGEALVNKRSTTWRGLNETERSETPQALLEAHPTLMKRPVIEADAGLTLGWDAKAREIHLPD